MNYNIATILAVIAIIFVLITYITSAPLVPVAVILLGLAIIFGGRGKRKFEKQLKNSELSGGPRNYGPFLILIHAVSAVIPVGMPIASTIVSTFIGICCFSYLLRIASREI
jgi:hypothetical protein